MYVQKSGKNRKMKTSLRSLEDELLTHKDEPSQGHYELCEALFNPGSLASLIVRIASTRLTEQRKQRRTQGESVHYVTHQISPNHPRRALLCRQTTSHYSGMKLKQESKAVRMVPLASVRVICQAVEQADQLVHPAPFQVWRLKVVLHLKIETPNASSLRNQSSTRI